MEIREDPIIITGAGHSGTRGLVEVFSAADQLYLGDIDNPKNEWQFYRLLAAKVNGKILGLPERHDHNMIPPDIYEKLKLSESDVGRLVEYVRQEIKNNPGASMPPNNNVKWLIKTPRTSLCLEVWRGVFPHSTIINLIRDGRDVAASLPETAGSICRRYKLWQARVRRMHRYSKSGMPIIDFRYEDMGDEELLSELFNRVKVNFLPEVMRSVRVRSGYGARKMQGVEFERFDLVRLGYDVDTGEQKRRYRLLRKLMLE